MIFEDAFLRHKELKRAICACSGGVDSMSLAFLMQKFMINTKIHYLIVNHNLREGSKKEAEEVKKTLLEHGFEMVEILEWKHEKLTTGVEEKARKARQNLIFEYAFKNDISDIFFGHHLGDVFENFFLKLGMGAGFFGLSLTPHKAFRVNGRFFNIIRPLVHFEKEALKAFANQNKINFFEDHTNFEDVFKRNRVRKFLSGCELESSSLALSIAQIQVGSEMIKARLAHIFNTVILFDEHFGFFSSNLKGLTEEEIKLTLKQMIFYFAEKCEVREAELVLSTKNLLAGKPFTLGGMEVFFAKNKAFFIKEKIKITNKIQFGIWDKRFELSQGVEVKNIDFNIKKCGIKTALPAKIIYTLPYFYNGDAAIIPHFTNQKPKTVQFKII